MYLLKQGFTFLELLITLAVSCILLAVATPVFFHFLARNKTTTVVNQLILGINFARSSAIQKGDVINFCGSSNSINCDGNWQAGQLVTVDRTAQIIRIFSGLPKGYQLLWRSNLSKNTCLKFAPSGFTLGQNGSFYYCPPNQYNQYGAEIIVSQSGRVRVEYASKNLTEHCNY